LKIIGFVGLPGSGKGEASQAARDLGLAVVVMGDLIRQEAACRGLAPTDENLGSVGSALRAEEGPDAVARRTLEMARATGEDVVVVDGLRSREEAEFFRTAVDEFHLIEVCAPAKARLKWLEARGRSDDPRYKGLPAGCRSACCQEIEHEAVQALERREAREISWGMSEACRAASLRLGNDGSLEEFRRRVQALLELLLKASTNAE